MLLEDQTYWISKNSNPWQAKQSADLYGIERWGNDYFGLSDEGHVTAKDPQYRGRPAGYSQGYGRPGFADAGAVACREYSRCTDSNASAKLSLTAIDNAAYTQPYRGVYPIKVNQQAQVVEEIADFGKRYHHGS